jgi:hypothetical protein
VTSVQPSAPQTFTDAISFAEAVAAGPSAAAAMASRTSGVRMPGLHRPAP